MSKPIRSIEDIFNDPDFDLISNVKPKNKKRPTDSDVVSLKEVENWINEHGHSPKDNKSNISEFLVFHKLEGLKKRADDLKEYDTMGLLKTKEDDESNSISKETNDYLNNKSFNSLDDILNDDSILFDGLNDLKNSNQKNLFKTEKVTRKQESNPEVVAKRHHMDNFRHYERMFKNVQMELASGKRELRTFKDYDIEVGRFYVLSGQLIYIESIGDKVKKNNKIGVYEDQRVHVIYENGTESNPLFRGLGSSLYGRGGRTVSEPTDKIDFKASDVITGYIYVLKSLSNNPQITDIGPLYKVGFTAGSIEHRISNAENESTYLYAPVRVIEQFQVINLKANALETAIHHALSKHQLDVDIKAPNGKMIKPREWFAVDLNTINEVVNEIVSKLKQS